MTWSQAGLVVAAGLAAYLLGRRKTVILLALAAFLAVAVAGGVFAWRTYQRLLSEGKPQLTLQLARRQWHVGEQPWYLLQMKNVGGKPFVIHDPFWESQVFLAGNCENRRQTYFEVLSPGGKVINPTFWVDWGFHGEFNFWANDCEGGICDPSQFRNDVAWIQVKPGQTLTATPSVVAPYRKKGRAAGPADARLQPGMTKEEIVAIKGLWKSKEEYLWEFARVKPYRFGPEMPPETISGFRILEGFHFRGPGIYRVRVIYDNRGWLRAVSEQEDIEQDKERLRRELAKEELDLISYQWRNMKPEEKRERREARQKDEEARESRRKDGRPAFFVESNEVELEIVP